MIILILFSSDLFSVCAHACKFESRLGRLRRWNQKNLKDMSWAARKTIQLLISMVSRCVRAQAVTLGQIWCIDWFLSPTPKVEHSDFVWLCQVSILQELLVHVTAPKYTVSWCPWWSLASIGCADLFSIAGRVCWSCGVQAVKIFVLFPQVFWQWKAGDLAICDTRSTLHCATSYNQQKFTREMWRTTIMPSTGKWRLDKPNVCSCSLFTGPATKFDLSFNSKLPGISAVSNWGLWWTFWIRSDFRSRSAQAVMGETQRRYLSFAKNDRGYRPWRESKLASGSANLLRMRQNSLQAR